MDWIQNSKSYKAINRPRVGKKLLVLDIDETIYDQTAPNSDVAKRQFLHEFLATAYEYYDIGIWSGTQMKIIKKKLNSINVGDNSDYKIMFYMDVNAMIPVCTNSMNIHVKSLQAVWMIYPQYDYTNTVICDNNVNNFLLNPDNGILVTPYSYKNHALDYELVDLQLYLKKIFQNHDFSKINHTKWKESLM